MKRKELRLGAVCRIIKFKKYQNSVKEGEDYGIILVKMTKEFYVGSFHSGFAVLNDKGNLKFLEEGEEEETRLKSRITVKFRIKKMHSVRPYVEERPYLDNTWSTESDRLLKLHTDRPHGLFPWVDIR